jgi:hypothetical protein
LTMRAESTTRRSRFEGSTSFWYNKPDSFLPSLGS